jgi:hypothetical protein
VFRKLWTNIYLAALCASWLHRRERHQQELMAETHQLLEMSRELIRRTNELIRSKQHEEQPRE